MANKWLKLGEIVTKLHQVCPVFMIPKKTLVTAWACLIICNHSASRTSQFYNLLNHLSYPFSKGLTRWVCVSSVLTFFQPAPCMRIIKFRAVLGARILFLAMLLQHQVQWSYLWIWCIRYRGLQVKFLVIFTLQIAQNCQRIIFDNFLSLVLSKLRSAVPGSKSSVPVPLRPAKISINFSCILF